MKTHALAGLCLAAFLASAEGVPITEIHRSGPLDAVIPDHQPVLTSFLMSTAGSSIRSLTRVRLTLDLRGDPVEGGYASDMFASLTRSTLGGPLTVDDSSAILLNRVAGGYDGWQVTFDDAASSGDVHQANLGQGVLSGAYQPDGRLLPGDAVRLSLLGVFTGADGVGDWRLNLGDLAPNGVMRLRGWELELTGENGRVRVRDEGLATGPAVLAVFLGLGIWRARRPA